MSLSSRSSGAPHLIDLSDLAIWGYCHRQYGYSRILGLPADAGARLRMLHGSQSHADHGRAVYEPQRVRRSAVVVLWLLILLAVYLLFAGAVPITDTAQTSARSLVLAAAIALSIALLYLAVRWFGLRRDFQVRTGLHPNVPILSSDTISENRDVLVDHELGLKGKPDYIVHETAGDRRVFAVELKTGTRPRTPYESHVLQVLGSILLLRSKYGSAAARFGHLVYRPRCRPAPAATSLNEPASVPFVIELTLAAEARCLQTIHDIRLAWRAPALPDRSHQQRRRCERCGHRKYCDQILDA